MKKYMVSTLQKVTVLLLSLGCSNSFSFSDGSVLILSEQLAQMKMEYAEVIEQVRQLKLFNQHITGVLNGVKDLQREYQFVKNFSLERELDQLRYGVESITRLDNMENADETIERINILLKEIEGRVRTEDEEAEWQEKRLEELQIRLNALQQASLYYTRQAGGGGQQSTKDYLSGVNSATSVLAAQALEEKQANMEAEIKRTEAALQAVKSDAEILDYLKGNQ